MKNFTAGRYVQQFQYKSFQPNPIHRDWVIDDMPLIQLLGQADRELGRLDMFSEYIPNIDIFIQMHVLKEAIQSSKIEGTQTSMEEALLDREDVAPEKRDDWDEVQNYVTALNEAEKRLNQLPYSSRLARETHRILLRGVRGRHKHPGEFRRSQNWIGGASLHDALFVPPAHETVPELMSDMERFVHDQDRLFPELLKIALVHYQFETIHPFLDGNGRIGRLLIPLYLVSRGILKRPILYLSDFFEKNRTLYYDNLMRVREKNDILQWFKFFLVGVIETARSGIDTFDGILRLQQDVETKLMSLGSRGPKARKVLNALYLTPTTNAAAVAATAEVSPATAYKLISDLERLGILIEITGKKKSKAYLFSDYFRLFTG